MNEAEERQRFNTEGNSWEGWWCKAEELLSGARCIRQHTKFLDAPSIEPGKEPTGEEIGLHLPMLLLRAFALECLLKARWLQLGHKLFANGKYQRVPNAGDHNLLQLAQVVGIEMNGEEKDVLRRLSAYGTGYGRYPAPIQFERTRPQREYDGMTRPHAYWGHASERPFEDVVSRLRAALHVHSRRGSQPEGSP